MANSGRNDLLTSLKLCHRKPYDSAQVSWNTCFGVLSVSCGSLDWPRSRHVKVKPKVNMQWAYGEEVLGLLPRNWLGVLPVQALDTGYQRDESLPSNALGPCPNDFWWPLCQGKKKKLVSILRWSSLVFLPVREQTEQDGPPIKHTLLNSEFHCVIFAFRSSLFISWKCREFLQKPSKVFPSLFIHLYSLYGFPLKVGLRERSSPRCKFLINIETC